MPQIVAVEAKATETAKDKEEMEQKVEELKENISKQVKMQTKEVIKVEE